MKEKFGCVNLGLESERTTDRQTDRDRQTERGRERERDIFKPFVFSEASKLATERKYHRSHLSVSVS